LAGHVIDDRRVRHFWDEQKVVGRWFAAQAGWEEGDVMWDVYFLYGPGAEWSETPGEPIAHAGTIEDEAAELVRQVDALLGEVQGDGRHGRTHLRDRLALFSDDRVRMLSSPHRRW